MANLHYFLWLSYIPLYVCMLHLYLSVDGHLGCCCISSIISNIAKNIGVRVSFQISAFVFFKYISRSGVSGTRGIFCLFFHVTHGLWDLSSLIQDWIQAWQWKLQVLTTEPPGNYLAFIIVFNLLAKNSSEVYPCINWHNLIRLGLSDVPCHWILCPDPQALQDLQSIWVGLNKNTKDPITNKLLTLEDLLR